MLNIDCPAERQVEPRRGKLDERFLRFKTPPPHRSLPFFPDLHTEMSRSWVRPFSARLFVPSSDYYGNVAGTSERGYRAMPRVEQTLASYLSPDAAWSLKAPTLPSKPLRTLGGLWQLWWWRRGISGWPCRILRIVTGSSFWTPRCRLLASSARPLVLSSTGTRRPRSKRRHSSGFSLAAL